MVLGKYRKLDKKMAKRKTIKLSVDFENSSDEQVLWTAFGAMYLIMGFSVQKQSISEVVKIFSESTKELERRFGNN